MNTKIIRKHFFFKGRVQGVGFRYRAQNAASLYSVTGWVKNLYDGSVEMEAQGTEEDIDKVVQTLQDSRYIVINDMYVADRQPDPLDTLFRIHDEYSHKHPSCVIMQEGSVLYCCLL